MHAEKRPIGGSDLNSINTPQALSNQIITTLTGLETHNVLFSAKSTDVSISGYDLIVTLRGIMSKAERLYARSPNSKAFLQTLYARQLVFFQQAIESDVNSSLHKRISGMDLALEPESGDVILTLPLSDM